MADSRSFLHRIHRPAGRPAIRPFPSRRSILGLAVVLVLVIVCGSLATLIRSALLPNPLSSQTLFARLMHPFAEQAQTRREGAASDPDYAHRIDPALAADRVNVLLFGYGETYEPPFDKATIGSYTIASFDTNTGKMSLISITHDVRAPEVERALTRAGAQVHAVKIDQAYSVGGFNLMRQTVEDATGMPIDYQVSLRDSAIKDVIDEVFGPIEIDVPSSFDTAAFFLDGEKFAPAHFSAGPQRMNGTQTMQFLKTLEAAPSQSFQRNARKDLVLRALLTRLTQACSDRALWLRISSFVIREEMVGKMAFDFDPASMLAASIGDLGSNLPDLLRLRTCSMGAPQIARTLYVVDPESGGDGVRWVSSDATLNTVSRRDIESGVYEAGGLGIAVPLNANPYGDLVTDYWGSVRTLVRQTLLTKP